MPFHCSVERYRKEGKYRKDEKYGKYRKDWHVPGILYLQKDLLFCRLVVLISSSQRVLGGNFPIERIGTAISELKCPIGISAGCLMLRIFLKRYLVRGTSLEEFGD